jgi:hypothetical protein
LIPKGPTSTRFAVPLQSASALVSPNRAPKPTCIQLFTNASFANRLEFSSLQMPRGVTPSVILTTCKSLIPLNSNRSPFRAGAAICHSTNRVRAVLAARAIRVRAVLAARAIIVGPHPPPFYTSSLTSPKTSLSKPRLAPSCKIEACPKQNLRPLARSPHRTATKRPTAVHSCPGPLKTTFRATTHLE